MSTATQPQTRTVTHEAIGILDQAIEQTPRTQSIRNTAAQFLGVPPDRVCALLRNVWRVSKNQPELTDAELFVGMSMIARFALDPIAKEVYVTRTSKGLCTIVGLDGWIKILDKTEGYDGFEQEYHFKDGTEDMDWVETKIFSKNRSRPTSYRAYAKEYYKIAGAVASQLPTHMLRIFSLRHAARLFTPLGGSVVTEEEARWMDAYEKTPEEGRTRQNKLKDKVAQVASEYEPIPQQDDLPLTKEQAALPPSPPTEAEIQEAMETETEPHKPADKPTESFVVEQYKESIAAVSSLKDANQLVTRATNDPLIQSCCTPATIAYIGELLQGAVTKEKQKKAQKSLV